MLISELNLVIAPSVVQTSRKREKEMEGDTEGEDMVYLPSRRSRAAKADCDAKFVMNGDDDGTNDHIPEG